MATRRLYMKEIKKSKVENLEFYIIKEEYINYLSKFDSHIAYNKEEHRPYVGVVFEITNKKYFAPLSSPKQQHKKYKENFTFFKLENDNKELGIIRFADMLPVPIECVTKIEYLNRSYGYRRLLSEQYSQINITKNKERIKEKAKQIYDIVTSDSNTAKTRFYKQLSCNYKLLEEKCEEYKLKYLT